MMIKVLCAIFLASTVFSFESKAAAAEPKVEYGNGLFTIRENSRKEVTATYDDYEINLPKLLTYAPHEQVLFLTGLAFPENEYAPNFHTSHMCTTLIAEVEALIAKTPKPNQPLSCLLFSLGALFQMIARANVDNPMPFKDKSVYYDEKAYFYEGFEEDEEEVD